MNRQFSSYIALAAFFVLAFSLLNWVFGYVIAFLGETSNCFFLFGHAFFREFLDHPAGPVRYAGRFLGQFYHYQWLGSLVVAASISCLGVLFHAILRKLQRPVPVVQTLLPCLLLLALHASTLWLLQDTLGVGVAALAFLAYLMLPGAKSRRVMAVLATVVVYFLAGGFVWLFVAWVILHQLFERPRRWSLAFVGIYVLLNVGFMLAAWRWAYMIPLRNIVICPLILGPPFRSVASDVTTSMMIFNASLAVVLAFVLLVIPFWNRLFPSTRLSSLWQLPETARARIIFAFTILLPLGIVCWVQYDASLSSVMECHELYKQRRWDEVLQLAKQNPYGDHRVQFMGNYALCMQGELLDEMFAYPQPWGTRGLFMNFTGMPVASAEEDDTGNGMYNSDLLFEMGHVNFSLRHAYNYITMHGATYESLERMAECSIANGNHAMAEKYLTLLERTLFHRDEARRCKQLISDPAAVEREFGVVRSRLPNVGGFGHPTAYFVTLLESRPDNRMAFEYLMAWLMLDKSAESLESLCADVIHLRDVGGVVLPTHCQEAMLVKAGFVGGPLEQHGFDLDAAIVDRVGQFQLDYMGQGTWLDAETAKKLYGDTYMYYWFFVTSRGEKLAVDESGSKYRATTREE